MRIALISTVYMTTPPARYGGIERVVSMLAEQLIKDGHDVTLFAVPGSRCSDKTVTVDAYDPTRAPAGIRSRADVISEEPLYEAVRDCLSSNPVDVVHDWSFQNLFVQRHPESFPFVISTCVPPPRSYARPNLVACSRAHASLLGDRTRFVHYGLPLEEWEYRFDKTEPLIHISKITRYKAQHLAIAAAHRAGVELQLAGNVEDPLYYHFWIKPLLLLRRNVTFAGELTGTNERLMTAKALVQTPRWFDAFPLVILEALASGTPVISFTEGGIPEQIEHGVTGLLCNEVADLAEAMQRVDELDPRACRSYAEEHFHVKRMARDYVALYEEVCDGQTW